jgi:TonB family protein
VVSNRISSESDLPTSAAEERTRTFGAGTAARAESALTGPATGDVLGKRFLLHECLASGGGINVFRALDQRRQASGDADPWVVLKVVSAPPGQEPRALETLRREAAIAQGLEHPNLPWIRGLDQDGPHTFLCLAWLPGESLATILDQRGPRPMIRVQALQVIEDIGSALSYLHGLGITHCDVKPGNILVSPEGHATLLDLGVALGPDSGGRVAAHGYTPQYASPEVLNGAPPSPADDLFSLACVAYRMIAGHRAFVAGTALDAAGNGERPEKPDNLSPAQWRALDRALAFSRADRQRDVRSFLAELGGTSAEVLPQPAADPVLEPVADPVADPVPAPVASGLTRAALPVPDRPWNLGRWWPVAAVIALALAVTTLFRDRGPDEAPATAAEEAVAVAEAPAAPPAPDAPAKEQPKPEKKVAPAPARRPPETRPPPAPPRTSVRAARDTPAPRAESQAPAPAAAAALLPPEVPAAATAPEATPPVAAETGSSGDGPVPFSRLKVRRYVAPRYPRNALTRRVAGWVEVGFTVDTSGRTRAVRVLNAEPPGMFDDAALAAVNRWRFDTAGGVDPPFDSEIRLRFQP